MPHDPRLVADESKIEELRRTIPDWIKRLERPKTPCVTPAFGPLEGIRAVGVTAGASAPEVLVNEVIDAFRDRFDVTVEMVETAQERVEFKVPRILRDNVA